MKTKSEKLSIIQGKIDKINKEIQFSAGEEQEILYRKISELKSIIAGYNAKLENMEKEDQKLYEKTQKLYTIRNELQDKQKAIEEKIKKSKGDGRNED